MASRAHDGSKQSLFQENQGSFSSGDQKPLTSRKMKIINPATEEVIRSVEEDSRASLLAKFDLLKKGQLDWSNEKLETRIEILRKFSVLLERDIEGLAQTLTSEVGKPLQQSRNEVNGARTRIKWLTENAQRFLSDEKMSDDNNMQEWIAYEPLGIVCNISAWNYPFLVGVNVFVPALLAGNAVLYKPSEYATLTGLNIERLLKEAGVHQGAFQVGVGGKETGEVLLDLPFNGYFFTGSYKTGKYIYEKVASKMVPCQCELGGKDPVYIADDVADIKSVAAGTADGAFYNNGQSCCAVERIYVHEKIYDHYLDEFANEVKSWKIGDPAGEGVYIGPLTRKDQISVIEKQVDEALKGGAKLISGGKKINRQGYYFEPTVLTQVSNTMAIMQEESFGPIIGIMKVKDDHEAIRLMNETAYGLTASVYSSSEERARKILSQIDSGTGYWNCCDRVSAAVPWSGRKHSGIGSTLSHAGLRAFTKPKAYHLRKGS
jgi:acyl-CoA reductase-like NAD-dependent aldehyde dehydrogenase